MCICPPYKRRSHYSNRILFKFVINEETQEEEILLLTLGSHDKVY